MLNYGRRWHEHNTRRRQLILDAALALLEEAPAGVEPTVRNIAQRAGLAKSVVYRQFDGRDDLFAWMRSYMTDRFADSLDAQLDLSKGSGADVVTRTISAVADFMAAHPRWIDLARRGPRHDDPSGVDALTSVKRRIAGRAKELLDAIAASVHIEPEVVASIPNAVVSMVEGALSEHLQDPDPPRTLPQIVSDLSAYTWYLIAGAARGAGLEVDPTAEVSTMLSRLADQVANRDHAT
ncbi:TetR/AcrR family transcriptional regulator [Mycobacterium talmoniae]|uniref:TetR/AcrR family transcriptional regulator n=1 Tax=Mycobacterium talmoniae TaxID=1858794 RepID=UPI001304CB8A|nr:MULTISPECIES: TetR/AcrR family transcriptional regulator [Mycobacterium]